MKNKAFQRVCSLVLTVMMLLTMLPVAAFAQSESTQAETGSIIIESYNPVPGETITVNVSLKNNPGIAAMRIQMVYDNSVFSLIGLEYNSKMGGETNPPEDLSNSQSPFVLYWNNGGMITDYTEDGVFAILTFKVSENAAKGRSYTISAVYDPDEIYNGQDDNVSFEIINGKYVVYDCVAGDIDGNGKVNMRDLTVLQRNYSGWTGLELNTPVMDANGDGKTNIRDVTTLQRYLAGWDVELCCPCTVEACTHNLTAMNAKPVTCTEDGNIAYWICGACGKYFSDAEAKTEISYADTVIAAPGHTEVIDEAVEPSCSKTGLTEGSHCSACGEVLIAQVEVGKTNHTPGAQATCTEDQVCTACGEVLETANGHVPSVEASCTEPQRCTVCQTVLAKATGHSLTYVEERDPVDEKDPGNRAYWQCSVCNKCYLDENATQEIALADTAWKIYKVYFFDLENDTYTVGAYKQSEVLSLKNIYPDEMKGYDFNGWHTSENFTEQNKISFIPAGNTEKVDLYANRSLHEYKITLLGLGKEKSDTYNIVEGKKLTTPTWMQADVGGDCLIFSHWSDENGDKITDIPAGEIGDRTIEANWIYKENYAVSNPNKYTYVGGYQNESGTYSFIYEIGAIKNLVLSVQHYKPFDGISEYSVADAQDYTVGNSQGMETAQTISQILSSSTAMAEIERNTTTHTEGWEVGGKIKPEVEIEGVKASIFEISGGYSKVDGSTVEKTGFTSENNYEENGVEDELRSTVDFYEETSASRTITEKLIPGVSPVGNYTWARMMNVKVYAIVTYNPYTGENVFDIYSEPTEVFNGLLYTLPSELEYEVNIVSGDVLDFEIPFASIPKMFYTVEYDANGGTGDMPKSVHEIGVSSKLFSNQFEKTGYTFMGWKTTANGGAARYTDAHSIRDIAAAGETVTLYAHWVKNAYKIQYNANKPSNASSSVLNVPGVTDCSYDTAVTLGSAPSLYGWKFEGWYKDAACKVKVGDANAVIANANLTTELNGTVTLYAKWTANKYTVTFKANGGTGNDKITTYTYDTEENLSANSYTRDNYIFIGWSTKSSATIPEYSDEEEVKNLAVNGNVTLYAVWVQVKTTAGYYSREIRLNKNQTHTDKFDLSFDRDRLIYDAGYKYLKLDITLHAKETNWIVYNGAEVNIKSNSSNVGYLNYGEFYDTSIFGDNWKDKTLTVYIDLTKMSSDCDFQLEWRAENDKGSSDDGWYLGTVEVKIEATKTK